MPEDNLGDPIPRNEPFVIPARPEETFDSVWLRSINIFAPQINASGNDQGSINIEMLPYDSSNDKIWWVSVNKKLMNQFLMSCIQALLIIITKIIQKLTYLMDLPALILLIVSM